MKGSAIVNISPFVNDKRITPQKRLKNCAKSFTNRWYGKIKELHPHIVICGGTYSVVKEQLKEKDTKATTNMLYFFNKDSNAIFLNCWHPSFRRNEKEEYTYFCESCREIAEIYNLKLY